MKIRYKDKEIYRHNLNNNNNGRNDKDNDKKL